MAGDVKLKISGDVSDLLAAVKSAMSQIQKEADKLKLTPAAAKAAPGVESVRAASQYNRSLEQKVIEEKRGLDLINKELSKKEAAVSKIKKMQEDTNKSVEREIQLKNQLARAERELEEKKNVSRIQQSNYDRAQDTANKARGIKSSGGGKPPISGNPPTSGSAVGGEILGSITRVIGATMGGIGLGMAAASTGEKIREFFSEAGNRARVSAASANQTQGQAGQRLSSMFSGGANEELMFDPLRAQAAKIADDTMKNRLQSQFRLARRPLESIFGKYSDHKTGPGTGAFTIDQMGLGTKDLQKEIENNQWKERSDIQAEQFEALKKGPEGAALTETSNKFLKDWRGNLAFQRKTGQTENEFRKFLDGVTGAGFEHEQGMAASSNILGAGGSSRAANGLAGFALQMGRQFDLTNADQAIGKISGQVGTSEMSKEALIKIQAEGTRIGVNQSEFREENRKFVEMAAGVLNQSTATSASGIDQIVSTFGKFMGDRTTTGMEAGKSAYEAYQRQSNTQTGPSAIMRAAGMMRDPILNQLSEEDKASLFTLNQADVNVDDPGIRAMAKKHKMSPEELVNAYHKVQNSSMFQRKSTDIAISRLSKAYKNQGPVASGDAYGTGLEEISQAEGEAINKMPLEQAGSVLNRKGQTELAKGVASGDNIKVSKLLEQQTKEKAESNASTGRPSDDMERQQAEANRLTNGLFSTFKDSIVPASDAVEKFAGAISKLLAAMSGTPEEKAAALKAFNEHYQMGPSNQSTAGPPANGGGFWNNVRTGGGGSSISGPPTR